VLHVTQQADNGFLHKIVSSVYGHWQDKVFYVKVFFRMYNDMVVAQNLYLTSGMKVITHEHCSNLCETVYSGKSEMCRFLYETFLYGTLLSKL
jgi:hypothetical protein